MDNTKEEVAAAESILGSHKKRLADLKALYTLYRTQGSLNRKNRKHTRKGYKHHRVRKPENDFTRRVAELKDLKRPDNLMVRRALLDQVARGEITRAQMVAIINKLKGQAA